MSSIDRKEMERRARAAAADPRLSESDRTQYRRAADKLEVANGLEAALERKRARQNSGATPKSTKA